VCEGSGTVSDISWTIPGKYFKDYVDNVNVGKLTDVPPAELTQEAITYYWAERKDGFKIKVNFKYDENPMSITAVLNVKNPTTTFTAVQGTVRFDPIPNPISIPPIKPTDVGLFTNGAQTNGMELTGKVKVPPLFAEGRWQFVQLVMQTDVVINENGNYMQSSVTPVAPVVDTDKDKTYPFAPPPPEVWVTGDASQTKGDSPQAKLIAKLQIRRSTSFYTYIMFKPNGSASKWVPLKLLSWDFKHCAQRTGFDNDWRISDIGKNKQPAIETFHHPEWTTNITTVPLIAIGPIPACPQ